MAELHFDVSRRFDRAPGQIQHRLSMPAFVVCAPIATTPRLLPEGARNVYTR